MTADGQAARCLKEPLSSGERLGRALHVPIGWIRRPSARLVNGELSSL